MSFVICFSIRFHLKLWYFDRKPNMFNQWVNFFLQDFCYYFFNLVLFYEDLYYVAFFTNTIFIYLYIMYSYIDSHVCDNVLNLLFSRIVQFRSKFQTFFDWKKEKNKKSHLNSWNVCQNGYKERIYKKVTMVITLMC